MLGLFCATIKYCSSTPALLYNWHAIIARTSNLYIYATNKTSFPAPHDPCRRASTPNHAYTHTLLLWLLLFSLVRYIIRSLSSDHGLQQVLVYIAAYIRSSFFIQLWTVAGRTLLLVQPAPATRRVPRRLFRGRTAARRLNSRKSKNTRNARVQMCSPFVRAKPISPVRFAAAAVLWAMTLYWLCLVEDYPQKWGCSVVGAVVFVAVEFRLQYAVILAIDCVMFAACSRELWNGCPVCSGCFFEKSGERLHCNIPIWAET